MLQAIKACEFHENFEHVHDNDETCAQKICVMCTIINLCLMLGLSSPVWTSPNENTEEYTKVEQRLQKTAGMISISSLG